MCYAPGLAKSIVCTICDDDEKIMESAKSETPLLNSNASPSPTSLSSNPADPPRL